MSRCVLAIFRVLIPAPLKADSPAQGLYLQRHCGFSQPGLPETQGWDEMHAWLHSPCACVQKSSGRRNKYLPCVNICKKKERERERWCSQQQKQKRGRDQLRITLVKWIGANYGVAAGPRATPQKLSRWDACRASARPWKGWGPSKERQNGGRGGVGGGGWLTSEAGQFDSGSLMFRGLWTSNALA